MIFDTLKQNAVIIGALASIISSAVILIKPLRYRVFCICDIVNGLKCVLRSDMLRLYYKNCERETIRQHEMENFVTEYRAYKALGGNSFIDKIYDKVVKWKTLT